MSDFSVTVCKGFETVHQLAEAQTDLAIVRDAMEATDEALARKEQDAAYMDGVSDGVKSFISTKCT